MSYDPPIHYRSFDEDINKLSLVLSGFSSDDLDRDESDVCSALSKSEGRSSLL